MISRFVLAAVVVVIPSVASADPRDDDHLDLPTKFTVEVAGRVVGSIISVDGLEHSHETVEYKDPEDQTTRYRPGNNTKTRIRIDRVWTPNAPIVWPHADDGTLTASPVSVVAERQTTDGAPVDTTFNLTGCLPTIELFGWRFDSAGAPYVVVSDGVVCEDLTVVPSTQR